MTLPDLGRLGIPGVAGLGLALFCTSFYFGSFAPTQEKLDALELEQAQLLKLPVANADNAERVRTAMRTAPSEPLPSINEIPELLKKLNDSAAKHGVTSERASYLLTDKDGQHRIEISLPLKGSYPFLRAYLRDALTLAPQSSLDEVSLQRTQASDPLIDANTRISYYLAASP